MDTTLCCTLESVKKANCESMSHTRRLQGLYNASSSIVQYSVEEKLKISHPGTCRIWQKVQAVINNVNVLRRRVRAAGKGQCSPGGRNASFALSLFAGRKFNIDEETKTAATGLTSARLKATPQGLSQRHPGTKTIKTTSQRMTSTQEAE
ncbi:hypothetical protein B0H13DRAFT_1895820 [Mycena leptocephala]|nr:hypothetical protein B0H13DRAFT_1895820 [Mycena leptocephala]